MASSTGPKGVLPQMTKASVAKRIKVPSRTSNFKGRLTDCSPFKTAMP